jgi:dCMP deaminase
LKKFWKSLSSKSNTSQKKTTLMLEHSQPVILAYIPVLHEGYRHFITKHTETNKLLIVADVVVHELRALQKDVRALSATQIQIALQALFPAHEIEIATESVIAELAAAKTALIAPYEDITRHLVAKYLPENEVIFDTIFLRWDKENSVRTYPPSPTDHSSWPQFASQFMNLAYEEAKKSADWWRQVGAVLVRDGKVLVAAYNRHLPTQQQPYINGDPRAAFSSGIEIELATSIHAEASSIATAARHGLPLDGAEIYTTTFPCPPCAKLIAESGIAKMYFAEGYSMLDGEEILKNYNVEIIKLESPAQSASQF